MTTLAWAAQDSVVIAQRHLTRIRRVPQMLFFSLIQPLIILLLFAFVFSSAIKVAGLDYQSFMLPGVFIQAMGFGAGSTAVGFAAELRNGMTDRFRSMPMAGGAVIVGRLLFDVVRNLIALCLLLVVGYAIGFRFGNGVLPVLGGLGVLVAFSFAISSLGALIGHYAAGPEAAQMTMIAVAFPLVFASSAYVPMESLPGWMQVWTAYSPFTVTANALRGLFLGYGGYGAVLPALAWCAGIVAVCLTLAMRRYRRVGDA
ncbi:ABC transporter permease [Amycolatopsis sp. NPDC021455]|uniref:ABC transporter permease n=1 Tax=Amycolatopsis sp. NPDC021455 TaxID=3154901 RepID=UPI003401418C